MDFALTDEQQAIFETARGLPLTKWPPCRPLGSGRTLPRDVLNELAELGMASIYVGEEYGSGLSRLDSTLIFEGLSYGCPTVRLPVDPQHGRLDDRQLWHRRAARRMAAQTRLDAVGRSSYCLTEPGSGSDAAALATTAAKTNENYVLNGTKAFISGGGYSDLYLVMVRTGGAGTERHLGGAGGRRHAGPELWRQ
jgi:alkylation response protein AidB-like acyl-CoA dehydrogenase